MGEWTLLASFSDEFRVTRFLDKRNVVSTKKKIKTKTTACQFYICKEAKKYSCPYEMRVVVTQSKGQSYKVYDKEDHEHEEEKDEVIEENEEIPDSTDTNDEEGEDERTDSPSDRGLLAVATNAPIKDLCGVCNAKEAENVYLFSWPSDRDAAMAWTQFFGWACTAKRGGRVCSQHFTFDQFRRCGKQTYLKPGAVPKYKVPVPLDLESAHKMMKESLVDDDQAENRCQKCYRVVNTRYKHTDHAWVVHMPYRYHCSQCDHKSSCSSSLQSHIRMSDHKKANVIDRKDELWEEFITVRKQCFPYDDYDYGTESPADTPPPVAQNEPMTKNPRKRNRYSVEPINIDEIDLNSIETKEPATSDEIDIDSDKNVDEIDLTDDDEETQPTEEPPILQQNPPDIEAEPIQPTPQSLGFLLLPVQSVAIANPKATVEPEAVVEEESITSHDAFALITAAFGSKKKTVVNEQTNGESSRSGGERTGGSSYCERCNKQVYGRSSHVWRRHYPFKRYNCSHCRLEGQDPRKLLNEHIKQSEHDWAKVIDREPAMRRGFNKVFKNCFPIDEDVTVVQPTVTKRFKSDV